VAAVLVACLGLVAPTGSAAPDGPAKDSRIVHAIRGMTLEEKVGQLFVANIYGESADTSDPADVAANQAMYGPDIRNAEELIDRYKLGGIVYFRWTNNLSEPGQIARLSNGMQ
jgi:beta-N-acetylhexosaminidase